MNLLDFQIGATSYSATTIKLAAAAPDQPIGDWSLSDLIGHLCVVNVMCLRSTQGHGPDTLPPSETIIGPNPGESFTQTTAAFISSFESLDHLDRICPTPVGPYPAWVVQTQGSLEHLIHAGDVAARYNLAGPSDDLVADAATRILAQPDLYATFRSMGMYEPPHAVDPNSDAFFRLRAHLGRET
jgi:hypothetical protein